MKINPRRPHIHTDGQSLGDYMESDRDFVNDNLGVAAQLLEAAQHAVGMKFAFPFKNKGELELAKLGAININIWTYDEPTIEFELGLPLLGQLPAIMELLA